MMKYNNNKSSNPILNLMRTRFTVVTVFFHLLFLSTFAGIAFAHSGGLNSQGCHAGSRPHHCHRSSSEIVQTADGRNRLRCDLGSRSVECTRQSSSYVPNTVRNIVQIPHPSISVNAPPNQAYQQLISTLTTSGIIYTEAINVIYTPNLTIRIKEYQNPSMNIAATSLSFSGQNMELWKKINASSSLAYQDMHMERLKVYAQPSEVYIVVREALGTTPVMEDINVIFTNSFNIQFSYQGNSTTYLTFDGQDVNLYNSVARAVKSHFP